MEKTNFDFEKLFGHNCVFGQTKMKRVIISLRVDPLTRRAGSRRRKQSGPTLVGDTTILIVSGENFIWRNSKSTYAEKSIPLFPKTSQKVRIQQIIAPI
jgi:hypothetical protein